MLAVMENIADIEKWMDADEEEEEEEEEEEVVVRLKRKPPPPPPLSPTQHAKGNGNGSANIFSETPHQNEEETQEQVTLVQLVVGTTVSQPELQIQEEGVAETGLESHEDSVYLDKEDGGESSNGINQMASSALAGSFAEGKVESKESGFTLNGVGIEQTLTNGNNHQSHGSLKDEGPSGFHLLLNGNSSGNGIVGAKNVERLLNEDKQEVAEWDVEKVLNEQETHDLYCPNCNSCITKRVILRKRKRINKNLQYDAKREKNEKVVKSSAIATNVTNDQGHYTTQAEVDGGPPVLGNDGHDPDTGPELFRCLTCFSFFIPAVSGFKLFWSSRKRGEAENVRSTEQMHSQNTDARGDDASQNVESDASEKMNSSQNLCKQQNDIHSSVIPVLSKSFIQRANNTPQEHHEHREDLIVSSTQSSEVKNAVEEKSETANVTRSEGDDAGQSVGKYVFEEMNSSQNLAKQEKNIQSSVIPVLSKDFIQSTNNIPMGHHDESTVSPVPVEVKNGVEETSETANITRSEESKLPATNPSVVVLRVNEQVKASAVKLWEDKQNVIDTHTPEQGFERLAETEIVTEDKQQNAIKRTEIESKLPGTTSSVVVSHVNGQVKFSAMKLWEDKQNVIVSSGQEFKHLAETEIVIDDKQQNAIKKTDIENTVMHVHNIIEPSNSLPYLETNLQSERISAIPKEPGAQLKPNKDVIFPKEIHIDIEKHKTTITEVQAIPGIPQTVQNIIAPSAPEILTDIENQIGSSSSEWDILKSIVYGGLIESITSLSVVSSAAGGDAITMNIVALGLAYLVGGLFVLAHGLRELKNEQFGGAVGQNDRIDQYEETLGHRRNFWLHATVAVISYLVFGLVAPITYGSTFYKSDNKEYKLIAVAAASLFCVVLLAIGKEYTRRPPKYYIKTVSYFFSIAVMASGLSYVVGVLIDNLLKKLGWFESSTVTSVPPSSIFLETVSTNRSWASY